MTGGLLIATVGAVGVLHTLVPDHWAPIVVIARQRRWSAARTGQAGAIAGLGHVSSTLLLGAVIWIAGAYVAEAYARTVSVASALALIAFGAWIAYGGWKEAHEQGAEDAAVAEARGYAKRGTALLLILGSSPMVEGLPAFLAASTRGVVLLGEMAVVFATATIATYVVTCVAGIAGLQRLSFGALERYGELLSGSVVALVGIYALVTS
jgi:hypothetical protein